MNKICTTIEQSRKLIELGVDVNTADMRYGYIAPYDYSDRMFDGGYDEVPYPKDFLKKNPDFSEDVYDGEFPAWSLAALLKLFDDKAGIAKEYETWFGYDNGKSHCGKHFDNPLDAAYDMVVWLLDNGYIKKGEQNDK